MALEGSLYGTGVLHGGIRLLCKCRTESLEFSKFAVSNDRIAGNCFVLRLNKDRVNFLDCRRLFPGPGCLKSCLEVSGASLDSPPSSIAWNGSGNL